MSPFALLLAAVLAQANTGAPDPLCRGHWLVDEENDAVLRVSRDGSVQSFDVGRWPVELVAARDGRVFVTARESGHVAVIARDGSVQRIPLGPEPRSLALDEARHTLYVGLVTPPVVVALNVDTLQVERTSALPFEPTALALLPNALGVGSRRSRQVLMLDLGSLVEQRRVALPADTHVEALFAWEGQALAVARFANTGAAVANGADTGGGYGGSEDPLPFMVEVLAVGQRVLASTGFAEVSAVSVVGDRLYLASRGERATSSLDLRTAVARTEHFGDPLHVPAVEALSVAGAEVVALDAHRRSVVFDGRRVSLPASRLDPELRLGRELFHSVGDQRISSRPMGCVSCHPDGREDGLVWQLRGKLRQTPMLAAGRLDETAPYNWLGSAPTLEANVRTTVAERLGGAGLDDVELRALVRYLKEGLRQVPHTPADDLRLARGREVFNDAHVGCASCHPADFGFTDGQRHALGDGVADGALVLTQRGWFRRRAFDEALDTPSLLRLSSTAPYFHDGSAATLEVLVQHNHDRMGTTEQLSADDQAALLEYLRSL